MPGDEGEEDTGEAGRHRERRKFTDTSLSTVETSFVSVLERADKLRLENEQTKIDLGVIVLKKTARNANVRI